MGILFLAEYFRFGLCIERTEYFYELSIWGLRGTELRHHLRSGMNHSFFLSMVSYA
ncbi:YxiF family protein [Bacillus sp. FSL R5-0654]|uniref:YxiF family protein n=1 Tax=Bacillus sp. FSL R5-0654 TaxID=2954589 RepID=UPI004046AA19